MRHLLVFFCLAVTAATVFAVPDQDGSAKQVDAVDGNDVGKVSDGDHGVKDSDGDDGDEDSNGDADDGKKGKVKKLDPKSCANGDKGAGRDNGFGSDYVWAGSLQSGLEIADRHRRPLMLIIHKSWCSACRNLAPKFADSHEIQGLSKHFVLVNVIDDDEPEGDKYAPDGTYIPRILFLSPGGDVYEDIYNERGDDEYRYFYTRPDDIAHSMRRLLRQSKH